MKTQLVYLESQYLKTCPAKIISLAQSNKNCQVVLDQTIFSPPNNGYPSDRGKILAKSGSISITHVSLVEDKVVHHGSLNGTIKKGNRVELELDWDYRYLNMRLLSAALIIQEAIMRFLPELKLVHTNLVKHGSTFLKYQGLIDQTYVQKIESLANQIVQDNEPINSNFASQEEIAKLGISVPDNLPPHLPLRLTQISSFTPTLNWSTHTKSTQEVKSIHLSSLEYDNGHSLVYFSIPKINLTSDKQIKSISASKTAKLTLQQFTQELESLKKKLLQAPKTTKSPSLKKTIKALTQQIPLLEPQDRSQAGLALNQLKTQLASKAQATTGKSDISWLDVTFPGKLPPLGNLHPISQAINEITNIFTSIGFTRVRYPEVDWDYYVFQALNMPPDHPARDEWETFFIKAPKHKTKGHLVLSTHTSNGQVREMERLKKPPIRMLNIAKCYRRQQDVTHTAMFHQFEGLVIDRGINIQHLKGTLDFFARKFYGSGAKSRIRPFMFRFTEPSFEVDFSCSHCSGKGCRFCKSGWHEVGGAGMVHPNVLRFGGIDPNKYTGFAFGWGIERVYTLKPGLQLDDIRPLYQNNLDFLSQF